MGAVDFSSEIAMPLNFTAECTELRKELKTASKHYNLRVFRGDKSRDFQTVSVKVLSKNPVISDDYQIRDICSNVEFVIKSRMQTNCTNLDAIKSSDFTKNFDCAAFDEHFKQCGSFIALPVMVKEFRSREGVGNGDH